MTSALKILPHIKPVYWWPILQRIQLNRNLYRRIIRSQFPSILKEIDVQRVWVKLEPVCVLENVKGILDLIGTLSSDIEIIPVLSDVSVIQKIIRDHLKNKKIRN